MTEPKISYLSMSGSQARSVVAMSSTIDVMRAMEAQGMGQLDVVRAALTGILVYVGERDLVDHTEAQFAEATEDTLALVEMTKSAGLHSVEEMLGMASYEIMKQVREREGGASAEPSAPQEESARVPVQVSANPFLEQRDDDRAATDQENKLGHQLSFEVTRMVYGARPVPRPRIAWQALMASAMALAESTEIDAHYIRTTMERMAKRFGRLMAEKKAERERKAKLS